MSGSEQRKEKPWMKRIRLSIHHGLSFSLCVRFTDTAYNRLLNGLVKEITCKFIIFTPMCATWQRFPSRNRCAAGWLAGPAWPTAVPTPARRATRPAWPPPTRRWSSPSSTRNRPRHNLSRWATSFGWQSSIFDGKNAPFNEWTF